MTSKLLELLVHLWDNIIIRTYLQRISTRIIYAINAMTYIMSILSLLELDMIKEEFYSSAKYSSIEFGEVLQPKPDASQREDVVEDSLCVLFPRHGKNFK